VYGAYTVDPAGDPPSVMTKRTITKKGTLKGD
jgi:hypothetical protein